MNFTLICDESSTHCRRMILGGLIVPSHNHPLIAQELMDWKRARRLNPLSEFKWKKVSARYLDHYKGLVDWFFEHLRANHFLFRAHVIDTDKRAYRDYGDGNLETAFYKVYHHLLLQSAKRLAEQGECNRILILLDDKTNRYPFRLDVLKKTLNRAIKRDLKMENLIANVETRDSSGAHIEPLIQVVDVLIGAIGFVRNESGKLPGASRVKMALIRHIESQAKTNLIYDTNVQASFNIWTFDVERSMLMKNLHLKRKLMQKSPPRRPKKEK